ncbi:Twitching motility protein PilT, partial [hydrothermal vent metagenome]
DYSYSSSKNFQFRFNLSYQKGEISATIRITPAKIPTLEELGLPPVIDSLTKKRKGLILLSGTAGSGKSTTLNYMIDRINNERKCKVITIEDPIEYMHYSKNSLVVQREVGKDTDSFASALKFALRQDPDVVVVGEMRDFESISMALTTAETGHLVISTVHAPDAIETINRIIDVCAPGMRSQVQIQMAENIEAIIGQMLVPSKEGGKRVLATEVLLATLAIRNMIRRGALVEVRGQLDIEGEETHTYEKCLSELALLDKISEKTAKEYSKNLHLLNFEDEGNFAEQRKSSGKAGHSDNAQEDVELVFVKKKILVVDEDNKSRQSMESALRGLGHERFIFGERGKDIFEQVCLETPNLVVLDLGALEFDGFEVCKQIKEKFKDDVKVVLITGRIKPTDPGNAQRALADGFVVKTHAMELLGNSVKKLSME